MTAHQFSPCFSALRGWSAADSLYFSFAALATIGIFEGPPAEAEAKSAEWAGGSGGGGGRQVEVLNELAISWLAS